MGRTACTLLVLIGWDAAVVRIPWVVKLQAYTGVSDDEVIEATLMARRWQLVLDYLNAEQASFSKGTLMAFRKRLIDVGHHFFARSAQSPRAQS